MKDIEGNKLIVDFMGVKPVKGSDGYFTYSDGVFFSSRNDTREKTMEAIIDYVKYSEQWNWLMPVVEKINGIVEDQGSYESAYTVTIRPDYVLIWSSENIEEIVKQEHGGTFIEMTYLAIVEFIKWYNEKKS
jgi:hypothetical protein